MKKRFRYVPIISIIFGIYWLYFGLAEYGFWHGTAPGAGFFPTIVGLMLIGFSVWILKTPVVYKPGALQKRAFYPVIVTLLCFVSIYLVGLIISMGLMVILWLLIIEKYSIFQSVITGICATVFIYLVFRIWLMVPFPKGLLGII